MKQPTFSHTDSDNAQRLPRMVVVMPSDESTRIAVARAEQEGLITPIIISAADQQAAAEEAVDLVHDGKADVIMKGLVSSDVLLRAVLRHRGGLLSPGAVLTHLACAEIPAIGRKLIYSDVAILPFPTHEQRVEQTRYVAQLAHSIGIDEPRIALVHCSEHVDSRHFPYTAGYAEIAELARKGEFGKAVVDGPLDVKTALDADSLRIKGISSPLDGGADALIFPNIEAGNVFHKTITLLAGATVSCVVCGARVPIVLPSRADDAESKYRSIKLAVGRS